MKDHKVNIEIIWEKKKKKSSEKRSIIFYKIKKFFKSLKNIFKLVLGALVLLGILQYSAIFPILDEINLPHDFEVNISESKIIRVPIESIKEILTEEDYNNFLQDNFDNISNGTFNSKLTNSAFIEIVVSDKKKLNLLNNIDIYEYREGYKNPLKIVNISTDDAALLTNISLKTISDEEDDYLSMVNTFKNDNGDIFMNYFTPSSAFSKKNTSSIFYLVFNQGIGKIIQRHYIVSYYHNLNKDIFEKIDSSDLNSMDTMYNIHKKYNTDKSVNSDLINLRQGYYYIYDILNN